MKGVDGVVLDIDGVLVFAGEPLPQAGEIVEHLRRRGLVLRFLTNSTLNSRRSCAERLRQVGLDVGTEEVVTASYATADYLRRRELRSCWVLLDGAGKEEFWGLTFDEDRPQILAVGDHRSGFDFETLSQALRVLANGAELVGMHPELIDVTAGQLELNVGAWVGMLERASRVKARYIGKPYRYVFDLTLRSMELEPGRVLMVGDQVATDVRGGRQAGMRTALIRTDHSMGADLRLGVSPDVTLESVAGLRGLF